MFILARPFQKKAFYRFKAGSHLTLCKKGGWYYLFLSSSHFSNIYFFKNHGNSNQSLIYELSGEQKFNERSSICMLKDKINWGLDYIFFRKVD